MTDSNPDSGGFPPVERVRQEVDRWLDAVRSTGERTLESLGLTGASRPSNPSVDVVELPEQVLVLFDLPGVNAESVELTLVGNMLTIAASRQSQEFPLDSKVHVRERFAGRYQRSVPLPCPVNDEAIHAETRDGLLTVTLRKSVPGPGRSIPVSRGGSSSI